MKVLPDGVIGGDAAVALGRIKDPQSVVRLIDDLRHPTTRTWAALALGKIGDPRAIEPLEEALKNTAEGWSRDTVRRALDKLKGKGE
jgi:HEAT repeat protein